MRRYFISLLFFIIIISGCGKKSEVVKLEKDTPAYQLAKDLSNQLPFLDPDSNKVLISTKQFDVTTGEVIQNIYKSRGTQTDQLMNMPDYQIKYIITQTAKNLCEQQLILNEAEKANFEVTQAVQDSILEQQFNRAGGEERFLEMLNSGGVNIEAVKNEIRRNTIFNQYLDETIGREIQITDEEIQNAYNEYKGKEIASVRHILLLTQEKNDAEKELIKKKMEDILAEAKAGEDFAELAKKYSEDPGSRENGGLYENFTKGKMVKPFEDAAFTVPIGEISDIVETQYGYHILKIIDRNNYKPIEEHRLELEKQLKTKKKPDAYKTYMDNLKNKAGYKEMSY